MADAKKCDRCGNFYTSSEKRLDSQGRYLKGITMDGLKYTNGYINHAQNIRSKLICVLIVVRN